MLKHSIKIIFRSLGRNRFYSISLIIGLSLSFTAFAIMGIFVIHESSTDMMYPNERDLYRVLMNDPMTFEKGVLTFQQLPPLLRNNFPEVKEATHLYYSGRHFIRKEKSTISDIYQEDKVIYADPSFLSMFRLPFTYGNVETALKSPRCIVLSQHKARKYFGREDVIGEVLYCKGEPYAITGVLKNLPSNTHFTFDLIISKSTLPEASFPLQFAGVTYVQLAAGGNPGELTKKLEQHQKHLLPYEHIAFTTPFTLEPLKQVYFSKAPGAEYMSAIFRHQDHAVLDLFIGISLAIVVMALLNYVNFSQSKALFYTRQNLIKRIFGAPAIVSRIQVIMEAFIIICTSAVVSFGLMVVSLNSFNKTVGSMMSIYFLMDPRVLISIGIFLMTSPLFIGMLANLFSPGGEKTTLNSAQPILAGKRVRILDAIFLLQLTVTLTLLAMTVVVLNQINFIKQRNPGYMLDNIWEADLSTLPEKTNPQTLKHEIAQLPAVTAVSIATGSPFTGRWSSTIETGGIKTEVGSFAGDDAFLETMGITLLSGRGFMPSLADTSALIVNETYAHLFHLNDNLEPEDPALRGKRKIIGIVKDFHYSSLKERIGPIVISYAPFRSIGFEGARIIIRSSTSDTTTMRSIERIWKAYAADVPFEYNSLRTEYYQLHAQDFQQTDLFIWGTSISVFISLFSLVGLSLFHTQNRVREIAIRKILGATSSSLLAMFIGKIIRTVTLSLALATPFILYFSNAWFTKFSYISIPSATTIGGILLFTVAVVILATLYQVIKVLQKNPADTLNNDRT